MANGEEGRRIMINTPEYKGEERRKTLIIEPCLCHKKHERVLHDHDEDIKILKQDHEKDMEQNHGDHTLMWEDIKEKVPNRLFYLFVTIVVGGLAFVYTEIHKLNTRTQMTNISVEHYLEDAERRDRKLDQISIDLRRMRQHSHENGSNRIRRSVP